MVEDSNESLYVLEEEQTQAKCYHDQKLNDGTFSIGPSMQAIFEDCQDPYYGFENYQGTCCENQ